MTHRQPKAVIALGGNALNSPGDYANTNEMRQQIRKALQAIWPLRKTYQLILTHGNGPQVGILLLRNDAGFQTYHIPPYPLDVLVAATQGEIGYLIENEWRNRCLHEGTPEEIASVVTMVEVDEKDPAFAHPVKRVGPTYFSEAEVRHLEKTKGWRFLEETKNGRKGWRRLVPSPAPKRIVNMHVLQSITEAGLPLIAAGGGGIPVVRKFGRYQPVEAVIDKDLVSALLAIRLNAEMFIILTDVPYVYLHYGTPDQQPLETIRLERLDDLIHQGIFGKGNMLPKILAARNFVKQTGQTALITDFHGLAQGTGTRILP